MKIRIGISLGVVLLLAMIAAATWAVRSREAPEVVEMRELTQRMFDQDLEFEQRRQLGEKIRALKQEIPKHRRDEVFREMGEQYHRQLSEHVRQFAALPEEERDAFLDRDIDMKQLFGKKNKRADQSAGSGGSRGRGDAKGRRRGGRPMTDEDRKARRRAKLDRTSAEDRAYMMEYKKAFKRRLAERGLKPAGRRAK